MIKPKEYDNFKSKLSWKIYNKEIKDISNLNIGNFSFVFVTPIQDEDILIKISDLFNDNDVVTPIIFADFLSYNNIFYKLEYVYCKQNTYKHNSHNLKVILEIKGITKKDKLYYKYYHELYKNHFLKGGFLYERNY